MTSLDTGVAKNKANPLYKTIGNVVPRWVILVVAIVALRLVLNVAAVVGAHLQYLEGQSQDPVSIETLLTAWVRWDAGYYFDIALSGYEFQDSKLAFFPLYPLAIRYLSFGNPDWFLGVGILISNLSLIAACLLLYNQVKNEHNPRIATWATLAMACFPTSFFFNAFYPEGLFILLSIAVYWFAYRQHYGWSALCVALASVTRPVGLLLLVIPLVELIARRPPRLWLHLPLVIGIGGTGVGLYALYMWGVHGSPIAFANAQSEWGGGWVFPGMGFITSMQVVLGLAGTPYDWFMRAVNLHDWLSSALFLGATIAAFKLVRHSLFLYMVAGLLLLLVLHGPYSFGLWSMPRYVLALFPGFIVFGIGLACWARWRWAVMIASVGLLVFFTTWFASGRWVS